MENFSFEKWGSALVDSKLTFYSNHPLQPTVEMLKTIYSCIDLTSLSNTDTEKTITEMVNGVNNFKKQYPGFNNVAGICVYPNFVQTVKKTLEVPQVEVVSVAGAFPHAQTALDLKVREVEDVYKYGADEIDIVINAGDIIEGRLDKAEEEVKAMKAAAHSAKLKVILETGAYKFDADIYNASIVAMKAGANFIKTSTGKMSPAATPRAAVIMALAIVDYQNATQREVGLKVAGGIRTTQEAVLYAQIIKDILGESRFEKSSFRIGATSLAKNVLADLNQMLLNGDK
jgi:deoxyribose-phosphate aldolase